MPSFSQRMGIRPMQKVIQRESIDNELRTGIWNALQIYVLDTWQGSLDCASTLNTLSEEIWISFLKMPLDVYPGFLSNRRSNRKDVCEYLRDIVFKDEWYDVYDLVEFILKNLPDDWTPALIRALNIVLETENAAYRIIEKEFVEITDSQEIEAVEDSITNGSQSTKLHIQRALGLLSDRKQPDYRNSIKESISAVESACNAISGDEKGTLGKSLKQIETSIGLHPSLKNAFSSLYGYTSDSGGIRHALTDESAHPSFSDAKFMLVACSAFCNFLWTKIAEKGQ
ncbi:AbiJ-NTD4 domain-containing protein [Pectobacterium aroidearum]|uniref:AbiJ-NTD4 domain-containing protein n=1 Tax=Pectobacterium aroidearum TaxID=1201031 RepID=UPI0032EFA5FF